MVNLILYKTLRKLPTSKLPIRSNLHLRKFNINTLLHNIASSNIDKVLG